MTLPTVPETFHWTYESWGAALRCRPLEPLAPHLFTTRQLQLPGPKAWDVLASTMGVDAVRCVRQVHGREVFVLRRPPSLPFGPPPPAPGEAAAASPVSPDRPEADAIVTDDPAIAIAVVAADCVPLLVADSRTGVVGAVHAGWRGTAARVGPAAVAVLIQEFGCQPEDLVVAIGPNIGSCCYDVGSDVVDAFAAAGHARHLIDRWFLAVPAPRGAFPRAERQKLRLDVAAANRDQLMLAGVPEAQIHIAELCTATNLDVLTSYRVERESALRIAGVIRAKR